MIDDETLPDHPIELFESWLRHAGEADVPLCHAVCLATASIEGAPSARMVLFQGIEDGKLRFFTDYRSRKARELDLNPEAAMVFYWQPLERQIRIEGTVERLGPESSDRYFSSRPRGSRVSAWASFQSAEVEDRPSLEEKWSEVEERFRGREVTRPPHWGGYGLLPVRFEFWQGRENRLHDRVVYTRTEHAWARSRLQP